jgi:RNA polymerase sporulation-specific sigma factor
VSVRRTREKTPVLTVVPDLAAPVAEEPDEDAALKAEIEAELAASLAEEITAAEGLVAELDRDIHGGIQGTSRWSSEGRSDNELVQAARTGDDGALAELLTKYRAFARVKARSYFLVGADREDIVQEGMIGLYKAIRDFNPDMQSSFRAFAELCVTRQIITAIKTATRQKHGPLNNYVSFSRPVLTDDEGERCLGDMLPVVAISDPADLVISAERIRALQQHFDDVLSDLEAEVLRLYVDGKSYQEIAEVLKRHVKSIDNALQRIKRKLDMHLKDREVADAS